MTEAELPLREKQVVDLLLQGYTNNEIATELKIHPRTVKAHFFRMFMRFQISGGVKRVKLATMIYRSRACKESQN